MREMKDKRLALLAFCGLAVVAVLGCSSTRSVGTQIDDATITTRVKAQLTDDDTVRARDIDVDTLDGVVTLSGRVRSEEESARAEELARAVEGVQDVENLLEVGDQME